MRGFLLLRSTFVPTLLVFVFLLQPSSELPFLFYFFIFLNRGSQIANY